MNGYPDRFVREWMRSQSVTESCNNHCVIIPYVPGVLHFNAFQRFEKSVFNVEVALCKLGSFFHTPKGPVPFDMTRGVMCQLNCLSCASVYVDQTKNSL